MVAGAADFVGGGVGGGHFLFLFRRIRIQRIAVDNLGIGRFGGESRDDNSPPSALSPVCRPIRPRLILLK